MDPVFRTTQLLSRVRFLNLPSLNFQTFSASGTQIFRLFRLRKRWRVNSTDRQAPGWCIQKYQHRLFFCLFVLFFCQGSLSFQLLGADGGLYVFGRSLCLLSTVRGLTVPSHNYTAVYNPRPAAYAYFLFLDINLICRLFFFFFLSDVALEFFKQTVYSPWQSPLCHTVCLSQILPGLGSGETKAGQDRG